jgi:hypothetical protein
MIATAQSVQGRSRASRGWLAALALGVALAFGAGSALAADQPIANHAGIAKKKDGLSEKAATLSNDKAKKDGQLDKDTLSQAKAGLDGIKAPVTKTGGSDDRKKP